MSLFKQGHALIVGAGGDLPNTADDALGLAKILREPGRCGYPPTQVNLLTGASATRDKLLAALDSLTQTTTSDSTVLFYFSGHGYRATSSVGEAYYLLPYGYQLTELYRTALSAEEFTAKLAAIPARKMLILLDCCHAGGVGDAKTPGLTLARAPLPPGAVELLAAGRGRVLIASSREDELSYAGRPYSAFTLALIEAFSGRGVAKKDGYVRVTDLALHAREVVPGRTRNKQHPILHFEQADNFALAYYAGGEKQPKGLPFDEKPAIEPEPGAWSKTTFDQRGQTVHGAQYNINGDVHGPLQQIDTGGAAYIGGGVQTGGGNFTGRDSIQITGDGNVIGNQSHSTVIKQTGQPTRIHRTFRSLRAIVTAATISSLDKEDLYVELEKLEEELTAGSFTARQLSRSLRNIERIAPQLKAALLQACADPTAGLGTVAQQVAAAEQNRR
ncbi:MAG: caspase family protein [Chloroflexota bacterium]|nr:caspase family protein [Chloroflexota bacterium]